MPHGGYGKRRVSGHKPAAGDRHKSAGGVGKKPKTASLKNQIRSTERLLRKNLPPEVRQAQERKLEELKKQQELHNRLAVERKVFLRDKKIKFFERRKIERRIRRLEKQQRSSSQAQEAEIAQELGKLKEDLEYVRFFPKAEKYVPLYSGGDNVELAEKRSKLRAQIKAKLMAAAASGKDLEETGSEDDGQVDLSDDDFFTSGSSSDEVDADDEMTDLSAREQASSASGKATSGMSSDERNQKLVPARSLMPPPRPSKPSTSRANFRAPTNASNSRAATYSSDRGFSNSQTGQSSNISSNSEVSKRRRKRRPKKKK